MTWEEIFNQIKDKKYFVDLLKFIDEEYKNKIIFPDKENIFNAFKFTKFDDVKVVIFGQDPYPNPNQAMGLAFSVKDGIKLPPSLKNIYREIIAETNYDGMFPVSGDLTYLAKQGVLLLNSILTVEANKPLSHDIKEYDLLFKDILKFLDETNNSIVFMLRGTKAKKYKKYLKNPNHLIIEANHPSPLSSNRGGWFGSNCFLTANKFLKEHNCKEIEWINKQEFLF